MQTEKYNGWTNYNTWKLHLNITNIYELDKMFRKEINQNEISLNDFVFLAYMFKDNYEDKDIDLGQVNMKEVYEALKEDN